MNEQISRNLLLETAWRRYAVLDKNSSNIQKQHMRMRFYLAALGILAVLFAIMVDNYSDQVPVIVAIVFRVMLIITPIVVSILTAFSNKFQHGQKYLSYRAAAEEILKEIYTYRVANKKRSERDKILSDRLAAIQRDLFRGVGGELVLGEYTGSIPPNYDPNDETSDPGMNDLTGDEYLIYRLENQLNWHSKKNIEMQRSRRNIHWLILIFGGMGAFLAAWGGPLAIWVAFTATIASALVGWEELRGLDLRVGNYSQVILELNIIRDWWLTLRSSDVSDQDVAKLAIQTEKVLFDQNREWVFTIRKVLANAESIEEKLFEEFIKDSLKDSALDQEYFTPETEEQSQRGLGISVDQKDSTTQESANSLKSMFAGISEINEAELDLPSQESYVPMPEPETVEKMVDSAIADSTIYPNSAVLAQGDDKSKEFDDEVSKEVEENDAEDEFIDEYFGEDGEEELGDDKDFIDELWEDEL